MHAQAQSHFTSHKGDSSYRHLFFCVAGIYVFFLTWGVLQERITTVEYISQATSTGTVAHSKFKFFVFLNFCQSVACVLISWLFLAFQGIGVGRIGKSSLFTDYLKVSVSATVAAQFGYEALRHINYPTMILGKSCKLVPVMLMNFLVYRRKFENYKYVSVALITLGVSGFMLADSGEVGSAKNVANSLYGLVLLVINLLIDGLTNSWQDQIFFRYRVKSQQMMFFMNLFSALIMGLWLLSPFTNELGAALAFAVRYPKIWLDIALFSLCGALGQNFIFLMLENFGSLSLVTVTVTRKLFTILFSLFYFNHTLGVAQWLCVFLVFAALIVESYYKRLKSNITI